MHIFITAPAKVNALYQCTQLIVGDQYSDLETMNFLGAKLVGTVAEAPPMWTLRAIPRAVMDVLQERGYELKMVQNIESSTTWIMSKTVSPDKPDERKKRAGGLPPHYEEKGSKIQSEDSMHSMPRGARKVPVKTKHHSKEGVEMAVTVKGAEPPPHDDKHHHSKHHDKGEKRQLYDEDGNPVTSGSTDSMAAAESENDTFSARPASGKSGKDKPRPGTPVTNDVKPSRSKHSNTSDEDDNRAEHDDHPVAVKKRKSPPKEKKQSPKRGSKRSIHD